MDGDELRFSLGRKVDVVVVGRDAVSNERGGGDAQDRAERQSCSCI